MVFYLLLILNLFIAFFLVFPFLLVVVSLFAKKSILPAFHTETDFACVITGYQNAAIAIPLIHSFINQKYSNYHIYFVADDCDLSHIEIPVSSQLTVLKPTNKLGSKVKSFIYAVENFQRAHAAVLILDPDNLGPSTFLSEINKYFNAGYKAVQGKRVAKNLNSVYACIDATGELYSNYTQKLVPYLLGSSANIAGSGMAISTPIFQRYLSSPRIADKLDTVIVAEDKILQNYLVGQGMVIAFAPEALIYDEKVAKPDQVVRQRSRWLNSYFENVKYASKLIGNGITHFSINQFLFGLITVFPPMFILVVSAMALFFIDLIIYPWLALVVVGAVFIFAINFMFVLYLSNAPKEIWKNLYGIPSFIFFQITALFKMKKANKDFLATNHSNYVTIDELLKKEQSRKQP